MADATHINGVNDPVNQALLDDWQRDFPVVSAPFDVIAAKLNTKADDVIERLNTQQQEGRITRVGAACAPNTVSASTLAAIAAPEERIEEVAAIIEEEPGVNHSYLREHTINLWFVVTGPDRAHVDAALARIESRTGLRVLDLRLVRPFNVDLGFALRQKSKLHKRHVPIDLSAFRDEDKPILQALTQGLALVRHPYKLIADKLGLSEAHVLSRISALCDAGIISRLGVIVRHRALGWNANAMVVWDIAPEDITHIGPELAAHPGITLCYERTPVEGVWPYRLYTMIHAQSRDNAMAILDQVSQLKSLRDIPRAVLFSLHCYKQTGAMIAHPQKVTA